jgi:hypothetical protein
MTTTLRLKPVLSALAVSVISIVLIVAFTAAPLLVVVPVAAGMWGYERWNNRRPSGAGTPRPSRASGRAVDARLAASAEPSFGFGSAVGRDL